ncbi:conserved domain protein [Ehrlichia chaffeensis str. Arkansas]|uniref:Conserved domain protein n=1 Tax=Ehrlichia chaffeensis (strain ATCC CRL-10679 / Arkansas) TaxID=205920 RepID=Q2GFF8_EHRCR|nr:conserved domain protein [Ehrlichia chaffeensis str. Arkansas]
MITSLFVIKKWKLENLLIFFNFGKLCFNKFKVVDGFLLSMKNLKINHNILYIAYHVL